MGASPAVSDSSARRTYLELARASTADSSSAGHSGRDLRHPDQGQDTAHKISEEQQGEQADVLGPLRQYADDRLLTSAGGELRRAGSVPRQQSPQLDAGPSGRGLASRAGGRRGGLMECLTSCGSLTSDARRSLAFGHAAGGHQPAPAAREGQGAPSGPLVPWDPGYQRSPPPKLSQSLLIMQLPARGRLQVEGQKACGISQRPMTTGTVKSAASSFVWERQLLEVVAGSLPRGTARAPLPGELERAKQSSRGQKGAHGQWTSPRRRRLMRDIDQLGAAMLVGQLDEVKWDSAL